VAAKHPARPSPCPIACALDIFGDRWTLLILRDLFQGKRHFEEFLTSPEGIATNILTARLKLLLDHGLIERTADEQDRRRFLYKLTARGRTTRKILIPLVRWGLAAFPGSKTMPGNDGIS